MRINLNNNWLFAKKEDFTDAENVRIPHTNCILSISYCNEKDYQFVSYYKKEIDVLPQWTDKSLLLTFEGAAHYAKVYVNGNFCVEHYGGYTAFTADIAPFCNVGINTVTVVLDSRESLNIAPFGNVVDYLTYGGLYREVYLDVKEKVYIKDVFVRGYVAREPYNFNADITLNTSGEDLSLKYFITKADNSLTVDDGKEQSCSAEIPNDTLLLCSEPIEQFTSVFAQVENVKLWDVINPNLYTFAVQLLQNGRIIDVATANFGFRECKFTPQGFYLNGKKVVLRGLNRHQSYPYIGYAMPQRGQYFDAKLLKEELCVNVVRTSHYPQSKYFLDACDKLGLLVITEIPGWQHIGDQQWKEQSCDNVREMLMQYRNHPSIILWGVRINESEDDDEFYAKTNAIARSLDGTRQTGGTRYQQHSHLLEDVYTYNDFVHTGQNRGVAAKKDFCKSNSPMLVTEYNGHMFPTKTYDDEKHRTEHALRHYNVVRDFYAASHLCGGLGWCMADYNTHHDFGSGDKICHHGVTDMFRNPKLAAAVYSSFGSKPVLEISSSMDKGEWAGSQLTKTYAFTNADSVKLYLNGNFIREFFPDKNSPLPHPPIVIDDFIGDLIIQNEGFSARSQQACKQCISYALNNGYTRFPLSILLKMLGVCLREKVSVSKLVSIGKKYALSWGESAKTFKFEAIKNGKVVKTVIRESVEQVCLAVDVDSTELSEGATYDMATVRIKATDTHGNLLPYCIEPVLFSTTGNIELIGGNATALRGGCCGTYVKSSGAGKGTLKIISMGQTHQINFTIK